jgi:signal transduction histidine kinase
MMPGREGDFGDFTEAPSGGDAYWRLFKPLVRRGLAMCWWWSIGLGLFLRGLEVIVMPDPTAHLGLVANVLATLIITFCAQAIVLSGWGVIGLLFWQHSQAARDRHARDGLYAVTPPFIGLLWLLVATSLGTVVGYGLWMGVSQWASIDLPAHYRQVGLNMSLLLATFSTLVMGFIDSLLVRAGVERSRVEVAQRQLAQAQLHRLQAQMEPHMLFNTLANLHGLMETRPSSAQDMLMHLISYLRATLTASRVSTMALGEEIAQAQDYLHLMQIRMGERLRVMVEVPDELASVHIPPMLIQPLIENAIKHGLDPVPEGGCLWLIARQRGRMLEIVVQDDGQGMSPSSESSSSSGFGLTCIRERLHTCYGGEAQFTLAPAVQGRGAVATLSIPVMTSP